MRENILQPARIDGQSKGEARGQRRDILSNIINIILSQTENKVSLTSRLPATVPTMLHSVPPSDLLSRPSSHRAPEQKTTPAPIYPPLWPSNVLDITPCPLPLVVEAAWLR
jgi:hypothetical protein